MKLLCALLFVVCLGASLVNGQFRSRQWSQKVEPEVFFPYGKRCGLRYDKVLQDSPWICNDPKYKDYPRTKIDGLLLNDSTDMSEYLKITKSCYSVKDIGEMNGRSEYYMFKSLCRTIREPINVLWAEVPGYQLKADEKYLNGGLLPVNVIEGQSLYNVKCEHPMASKPVKQLTKIEQATDWKALRKYCWIGYSHNRRYVCKPSGYINREVLVYSRHANRLFYLTVPNVPTSCACTLCGCNPRRRRTFRG